MAFERISLLLTIVLLGSIPSGQGQHEDIMNAVRNVFLANPPNPSESEAILKSARGSFLLLKNVDKQAEANQKSNFAKNYANFLKQLLERLETKDVDLQELFSKENSFLKDYKLNSTAENVNVTTVLAAVEKFQIAAEQLLIPYHNTSGEFFDATEILNLESSSFESFLKEKLRADYSEIGYFFLEVFATLIGLSWGIISTVIHVAENMGGE